MDGTRPEETTVDVNGLACRVWSKGSGEPMFYLAGFGGLPKWTPFLDRLAARRRVVAPSLPGFPGSLGHERLDSLLDWLLAARDLLAAVGMRGHDLVAGSVAAPLAAEVAGLWPESVRRLVLIAPFGIYDEAEPTADVWAQRPNEIGPLLCADPERWAWLKAQPEGSNSVEWPIEQTRAAEASARYLWPLGETGIARRLGRIVCPALLLWGEADRVVPPAYARRFAEAIGGPATVRTVPGAGHLAELDRPEEAASAILEFLG